MFQNVGKSAFKKDLTNIRAICQHLGNPQNQYPIIHIAGTNGKGTVSHMLASILQAAGQKVGLYTSPHYIDFRERVKINGQLIPEQAVVQFVHQLRESLVDIKPSFFEFGVGMAFQYFAEAEVDVAIIETGLGGRLDSTNIVTPILSIITNISYDHQEFLGNTLTSIAKEKAGIIKAGIPVVVGQRQVEVSEVFLEKARAMQAEMSFASDHFQVRLVEEDLYHSWFEVNMQGEASSQKLKVQVHGPFQAFNLQTTLQACAVLSSKFELDSAAIRNGLENLKSLTYYIGRWQILQENPLTITDSAHNEAGLKLVIDQLAKMKYEQLHIVLGTVKDKNWKKLVDLFPSTAKFYLARAKVPRGLETEHLAAYAKAKQLDFSVYASVNKALENAKRAAGDLDLIFVGGSTFVTAEILG